MEAAASTTKTRKPRTTTPAQEAKAVKAEAAPKKETVQQLKNRLRNEAEREVLNDHKDEVIAKTEAKYKEHNLEYVRRLSDEEKAQKAIEDNLAKYPGLREKMLAELAHEQMQDHLRQGQVDDNGDALGREAWETADAESRDAAEAERQ